MNQKAFSIGAMALFVAFLIGNGALFIVHQTQQVLVLQFGELKRIHKEPGLKIKIPFIQDIIPYEKRLLDFNLPVLEVIAGDQKRLVVDLYTRYKINDPLLFYKKVRTEQGARKRLEAIVSGSLRRVIGKAPLVDLLSEKRSEIMALIQTEVSEAASELGITIKDVRIIRADLPAENSKAIFDRMVTERQQEANLFRAEGQELAEKIRSEAEKERTVIIAQARKESEILRGEGDAKAYEVYADAFGKDSSFFEFYRTLQTYESALNPENTTYVMSPDNKFLSILNRGQ